MSTQRKCVKKSLSTIYVKPRKTKIATGKEIDVAVEKLKTKKRHYYKLNIW